LSLGYLKFDEKMHHFPRQKMAIWIHLGGPFFRCAQIEVACRVSTSPNMAGTCTMTYPLPVTYDRLENQHVS
jgi:hypothetical protein